MKQFLAVFTGSKTGAKADQWNALTESARNDLIAKGKLSWTNWMIKHQPAIAFPGGPLSTTKLVNNKGITDINNQMSAFVIVKAESQDAAAKMFLEHPHFTKVELQNTFHQ
jgi:hypothetical protein